MLATSACVTSGASKSAAAERANQPEHFSQDLCLDFHRDGLPPIPEGEME